MTVTYARKKVPGKLKGARVVNPVQETVTNAELSYPSIVFADAGYTELNGSSYRLRAPRDGRYQLSASAILDTSGADIVLYRIRGGTHTKLAYAGSTSVSEHAAHVSIIVEALAGDTFYVKATGDDDVFNVYDASSVDAFDVSGWFEILDLRTDLVSSGSSAADAQAPFDIYQYKYDTYAGVGKTVSSGNSAYAPLFPASGGSAEATVWLRPSDVGTPDPEDVDARIPNKMTHSGKLVSVSLRAAEEGGVNPFTVDVLKNGVSIGSATWSAGEGDGVDGVIKTIDIGAANQQFAVGDLFQLRASASANSIFNAFDTTIVVRWDANIGLNGNGGDAGTSEFQLEGARVVAATLFTSTTASAEIKPDTVVFGDPGYTDTSAGWPRLRAPQDGRYLINISCQGDPNSVIDIFRLRGGTETLIGKTTYESDTGDVNLTCSFIAELAAGDIIVVRLGDDGSSGVRFQFNGVSSNFDSSGWFEILALQSAGTGGGARRLGGAPFSYHPRSHDGGNTITVTSSVAPMHSPLFEDDEEGLWQSGDDEYTEYFAPAAGRITAVHFYGERIGSVTNAIKIELTKNDTVIGETSFTADAGFQDRTIEVAAANQLFVKGDRLRLKASIAAGSNQQMNIVNQTVVVRWEANVGYNVSEATQVDPIQYYEIPWRVGGDEAKTVMSNDGEARTAYESLLTMDPLDTGWTFTAPTEATYLTEAQSYKVLRPGSLVDVKLYMGFSDSPINIPDCTVDIVRVRGGVMTAITDSKTWTRTEGATLRTLTATLPDLQVGDLLSYRVSRGAGTSNTDKFRIYQSSIGIRWANSGSP